MVLTKADLLRPEALAQARRLVAADLLRLSAPEEAGQPTDTQQVTEQEVEELLRSEVGGSSYHASLVVYSS